MPDDKVQLALVYDGPGLRDGTMDVRDLAPALIGLSDLVGTANALLTGDRPDSIVIRARADFRKGSFETHLIVALALLEAGRQVVMSPRAMTLKAVLDWTLKGRDGLMWLVKKLKGRPPKKVTVTDDGEFLDVETEDTKIRVKRFLGQLYGDPTIRLKLAEIVAPVQRPGVDSFEARVEGEPGERVTKDEANWFLPRAEEPADERKEVVAETVVQILKPWLRSGEIRHKWKFIDARGPFSATMDDRDFLQRVESGDIKLGARDMFRVSLKTTMMTNPKTGRLRREHAVVRVLGAESAPHQLVLPAPSK